MGPTDQAAGAAGAGAGAVVCAIDVAQKIVEIRSVLLSFDYCIRAPIRCYYIESVGIALASNSFTECRLDGPKRSNQTFQFDE